MLEKPFLTDIRTLRTRTRQHIDEGAARAGYSAHRETVLKLLHVSLATEMACVVRYQRYHALTLKQGNHAADGAVAFAGYAEEEQAHADQIADRIVELGGEPDLTPEGLMSRNGTGHATYESFVDMLKEDMIAECITIDNYRDIIAYLSNHDPRTCGMMAEILRAEEKHAAEIAALLEAMPA